MMATPVDSSFISSQSDDFENLNDSEMSESLIYCLNGNEPIEYLPAAMGTPSTILSGTPRPTNRQYASNSCQKTISIKRPLKNDIDSCSSPLNGPIYGDYSCVNAKKNHLELDETAL